MKAVILAAGRGARMMPLTAHTPKPLLAVAGKTLFDYTMDLLPDIVTEVIVVVSYLGDQIEAHARATYPNWVFRFLQQPALGGTANALQLAAPYLRNEKFLVLFADDLHSKRAVGLCAAFDLGILAHETAEPERFGIISIVLNTELQARGALGQMMKFVEKPKHTESNLANVGVCVLDDRIFQYTPTVHANGEYYLTDMVDQLSRNATVAVVETDFWLPIGYPNDLQYAEDVLKIVKSK